MTDVADLQPGVTYAISLDSQLRPRPLQAWWHPEEELFVYIDPERPHLVLKELPDQVTIQGRWNDTMLDGRGQGMQMTWAGLAAHELGQVLRQQALARRLTRLGVKRDPEPYIIRDGAPNWVDRSLVLNFDELGRLLDRAGV